MRRWGTLTATPFSTEYKLFFFNKNRALRFGFSADGCITHSINGKSEVNLACYHPTLPFEWRELVDEFDLDFTITKHKNSWCRLSGIRACKRLSIKKFYSLGGFIDGVKISKKSKRHCGMVKNELLKKVVEDGNGRI